MIMGDRKSQGVSLIGGSLFVPRGFANCDSNIANATKMHGSRIWSTDLNSIINLFKTEQLQTNQYHTHRSTRGTISPLPGWSEILGKNGKLLRIVFL